MTARKLCGRETCSACDAFEVEERVALNDARGLVLYYAAAVAVVVVLWAVNQ